MFVSTVARALPGIVAVFTRLAVKNSHSPLMFLLIIPRPLLLLTGGPSVLTPYLRGVPGGPVLCTLLNEPKSPQPGSLVPITLRQ